MVNQGSPRFLEILEELKEIHLKKSAGYAGSDNPDTFANFRKSQEFGISAVKGCLVRMSDKFVRVCNLIRLPSNEQVGETIKDTLKDLASYAIIMLCLIEEEEADRFLAGDAWDGKIPGLEK